MLEWKTKSGWIRQAKEVLNKAEGYGAFKIGEDFAEASNEGTWSMCKVLGEEEDGKTKEV